MAKAGVLKNQLYIDLMEGETSTINIISYGGL